MSREILDLGEEVEREIQTNELRDLPDYLIAKVEMENE